MGRDTVKAALSLAGSAVIAKSCAPTGDKLTEAEATQLAASAIATFLRALPLGWRLDLCDLGARVDLADAVAARATAAPVDHQKAVPGEDTHQWIARMHLENAARSSEGREGGG